MVEALQVELKYNFENLTEENLKNFIIICRLTLLCLVMAR